MSLTQKQGETIIDALSAEQVRERTRLDLLSQKKLLTKPPKMWITSFFALWLVVAAIWLFSHRQTFLFVGAIFMASLGLVFLIWQNKVKDRIRELDNKLQKLT